MSAPERAAPAEITAARLLRLAPRCDYLAIAPALDRAARHCGIDSPRRVRHWLAQLAHESAGFTRWVESVAWKDPVRLDGLFRCVAGVADAAALIATGPRAVANRIYAGKCGNGDAASGDGWRFRGRGPIQLTGRANYALASRWVDHDLVAQPDLAADVKVGAMIAGAWWAHHRLNEVVDADPGEVALADIDASLRANEFDDVRAARRIINGGTNGLDDTQRWLRLAATIWRD